MKFEFSALKKIPKGQHIRGSGVLRFMNPARDWIIGLASATTVFVGGILYISYDFYRQFGVPDEKVMIEEQPVTYQSAEVLRYAKVYDEKEQTFKTLRASRAYTPPIETLPPPLAEE